jgi:glycosyltransferase involved in cell wall biosynthesis
LTICIGQYVKIGKVRAITQFYAERKQLERYMKSFPCDVYNANWSYEYAMAALNIQPDRTIVTLHDWAPRVYELMHDFYRKRRLDMNNIVMNRARYFTAVSDYIRNTCLNKYPETNVLTVGNCFSKKDVYTENKNLREENQIIVVSSHGFNDLKNTKIIIDAFPLIREKIPGAILNLYGCDHDKGEDAEKYSKKKGIEKGINFNGPVTHDEMIKAIRNADLLIHPSKEESFGLTIIEAMINKTPVIGGEKTGGVKEIINKLESGYLTDINDKKKIEEAAVEILNFKKIWNQYVYKGMEGTLKHYSVENIAEQYISIYKRVLTEKGRK